MPDTAKTIAKMQRYSTACDRYQIISCKDIATLLSEIERLSSIEIEFKAVEDYWERSGD